MKILFLFSLVAFATTFSGSLLPIIGKPWKEHHLWRLVAFSSGVLLGIAFLHLVPESFELAGRHAALALLFTFALLYAAESVTLVHACEDFLEPQHHHFHLIPRSALLALTVHALIDGLVIGVGLHQNVFLGSIMSFGVILHKFSDGLTLSSLLAASQYSKDRSIRLGASLAAATPTGAFVGYFLSTQLPSNLTGIVLGMATGSFIYVGAADLLPRLHHVRDRYCIVFFLLGIAIVGSFH